MLSDLLPINRVTRGEVPANIPASSFVHLDGKAGQMMQEISGRPCSWRILLEVEETIMTIVYLHDINQIWGVIGKKVVHVSDGGHFIFGFVLEPVHEGVFTKSRKLHSWGG